MALLRGVFELEARYFISEADDGSGVDPQRIEPGLGNMMHLAESMARGVIAARVGFKSELEVWVYSLISSTFVDFAECFL
jgi:hypothetical protein